MDDEEVLKELRYQEDDEDEFLDDIEELDLDG